METRNRFVDPLDQAVDHVRFDSPTESEVHESKARVWARLEAEVTAEARSADAEIRGCEDFRSLFPAYRAGKVSESREMLIQDHLRECGACRRAYESGARTNVLQWTQPVAGKRAPVSPLRRFAIAAGLVAAVGAGVWTMRDSLLPAGEGPRATLASATGPAYLIRNQEQRLMKPGEQIGEKEWIRTASGSRAMVRLADGSMVEMNERSELAVSRNRADTTVYLERGHIIVEAAKRRQGHLIVHTEDSDVYVTGTVFAVNRGVLGSRVSVAEGSVAVKARRGDTTLAAGEQYAASRFVAAEPVEQDFAWSANATQHLALLNEFAKVKNQWQKLQLPELRYDSTLLRQMPAGTVFFAALPNLGPTVEQAWGVFQNQMSQSAVLKQWWEQEQPTPSGRSLEDAVRQIKTFHEYLGKEVVFAAMNGPDGRKQFALIADVTKSGLDSYIKSQLPAGSPAPEYAIVNNTIVLGLEGTSVSAWAAWAGRRADSGFANSGLGQRLMSSYRQGTNIIVGLDTGAVHPSNAPVAPLLDGMRYFVAEHRTLQQRNDLDAEMKAALTFNGTRKGLASVLAAPSAAGSLDYFSPNASVAASLVATRPEAIYDEFIGLLGNQASGLLRELQEVERRTGMSIRNDIAPALGEDATFGVDGPLLPIPAWKAVFEVRDPARIQLFLGRLVAELNTELAAAGGVKLTQSQLDGRTIYSIQFGSKPAGVQYLFNEGYWILASDQSAIKRAIRARTQNWRLANSWEFRERLPLASAPHYSGMVYMNFTNVADMLEDAAGAALPAAQVEQFRSLASNIKPVLICLYGEPDTLRIQTRTGLLGLTMDQWLGASGLREIIGLSPLRLLGGPESRPTAEKREHRVIARRISSR
jgi:ferric-dicitrate binding protein FerR (iron transport regulator)